MSCRILTGIHANQLATARSVAAATVDSLFPVSYLYDEYADRECRATGLTLPWHITVDRALWAGGGFEGASLTADGWTGTGTAAETAAQNYLGARSCLLKQDDTIYRDVTVRAGGTYVVSARVKAPTGAPTVNVFAKDMRTGKHSSSGAWIASSSVILTGTGANDWTSWYAESVAPAVFAVDTFANCLAATTTLRITIQNDGIADAYVDEVNIWPRHCFTAAIGHNLDPGAAISVRYSDDAFATDGLVAALTNRRLILGEHHTANDHRYSRFLVAAGTGYVAPTEIPAATEIPHLGELIMGEDLALAATASVPLGPCTSRVRQVMAEGVMYSINDAPSRDVLLDFLAESEAQWTELEQELFLRSLGGRYPAAIMPNDSFRPDLLFYGRAATEWQWTNEQRSAYRTQVMLRGAEMPVDVG